MYASRCGLGRETFGSVESVKAASDVYAPVAGEVVEINEVRGGDAARTKVDLYDFGVKCENRPDKGQTLLNLWRFILIRSLTWLPAISVIKPPESGRQDQDGERRSHGRRVVHQDEARGRLAGLPYGRGRLRETH